MKIADASLKSKRFIGPFYTKKKGSPDATFPDHSPLVCEKCGVGPAQSDFSLYLCVIINRNPNFLGKTGFLCGTDECGGCLREEILSNNVRFFSPLGLEPPKWIKNDTRQSERVVSTVNLREDYVEIIYQNGVYAFFYHALPDEDDKLSNKE